MEVWGLKSNSANIDMYYQIGVDVPVEVIGDSTRLKQVLGNLLNNACKFTESGEIRLEVTKATEGDLRALEIEDEKDEKVWLHFLVQDSGKGISAENLENLFTSFYQGEVNTNRLFGGTGLGLVISKELCELMEGKIWAESAGLAGLGSRFSVLLPFTVHDPTDFGSVLRGLSRPIENKNIAWITGASAIRQASECYGAVLANQLIVYPNAERALADLRDGVRWDDVLVDQNDCGMHYVHFAEQVQAIAGKKVPLQLIVRANTTLNLETYRYYTQTIEKPIRWTRLLKYLMVSINASDDSNPLFVRSGEKIDEASFSKKYPLDILVVEDNRVNQQVFRIMMERLGYQIQVANNGREALDLAAKRNFQVIFMDKQMPDMDGFETAIRIIDRPEANKKPYIVMVTAQNEGDLTNIAKKSGIDSILPKPIRMPEVVQALTNGYWSQINPQQALANSLITESRLHPEKTADESPSDCAIDRKLFEEFWDPSWTRPEDLQRIGNIFISESKKQIDDMLIQIKLGNLEKARRTAHSLKGSSASIGGKRFSELCQYFENRSNDELLETGLIIYNEIQIEYDRLIKSLNKMLEI